MNKFKNKKIKKKPLIFLAILLAIGIVGATFAYYYTEVAIPNQFKVMTYDVGIEEEFYNDFGTKKVSFVNNEENGVPVLLRMHYNESWVKTIEEDGETIEKYLNTNLSQGYGESVTKNWTADFENSFVYNNQDGWYYYTKVLNGGEAVQILESIEKNSHVPTSYNGYTYKLTFTMESIQASEAAARRNWGKKLNISGGDVNWIIEANPS